MVPKIAKRASPWRVIQREVFIEIQALRPFTYDGRSPVLILFALLRRHISVHVS